MYRYKSAVYLRTCSVSFLRGLKIKIKPIKALPVTICPSFWSAGEIFRKTWHAGHSNYCKSFYKCTFAICLVANVFS